MPESPSTYCRKCGYNLAGLVELRCPECGRGFDPADPHTFYAHSWEHRFRRGMRRVLIAGVIVLLTSVLVAAGGIGWLYWGWRAEQPARKSLSQARGWIDDYPIGPDWVARMLPPHCRWLLDRTSSVILFDSSYPPVFVMSGPPMEDGQADLTDAELAHLETLHYLKRVLLQSPRITDAGLRHLRELRRLRVVGLQCGKHLIGWPWMADGRAVGAVRQDYREPELASRITSNGLVYLKDMPHLEELSLVGSFVTNDSLAIVGAMQSLYRIDLSNSQVTDAGLAHLRSLSNLRYLRLDHTSISDASIPILLGMQLREVSLEATSVSAEGFKKLRASIPEVMGP